VGRWVTGGLGAPVEFNYRYIVVMLDMDGWIDGGCHRLGCGDVDTRIVCVCSQGVLVGCGVGGVDQCFAALTMSSYC